MTTDWNLVRNLMNAAIDACEEVEKLGVTEKHRGLVDSELGKVTMFDYLQSAWVYPENVSYEVIRQRHDLKNDRPYTNELSRTMVHVGNLAGELVGSRSSGHSTFEGDPSIHDRVEKLIDWYRNHFVNGVRRMMGRV